MKICKLRDLCEKKGRKFLVGDTEIAVIKNGDSLHALSNICPHQHAAIIFDGFIEDGFIVCPAHGWEFNLLDGKTREGGNGLEVYGIRVLNDDVYVKVKKKNNFF